MKLRNCMEEYVGRYVDGVMSEVGMCCCDKCRYDVMAIALNNLPPQYTVTNEGALFNKVKAMDNHFRMHIIAEITKAAEIVNRDAKHYEKEEK